MNNRNQINKYFLQLIFMALALGSCSFGIITNRQMDFEWTDLGYRSHEFTSNFSDQYHYIHIIDEKTYLIRELDADITLKSGTESNIFGIVYAYKDRNNYSYVVINSAGYVGEDWVQDGRLTWKAMSLGACPGVRTGLGETNTIRIRDNGYGYIKIYMNDNVLPTYQFGTAYPGKIGFLCGGASPSPVHCDFSITNITEY